MATSCNAGSQYFLTPFRSTGIEQGLLLPVKWKAFACLSGKCVGVKCFYKLYFVKYKQWFISNSNLRASVDITCVGLQNEQTELCPPKEEDHLWLIAAFNWLLKESGCEPARTTTLLRYADQDFPFKWKANDVPAGPSTHVNLNCLQKRFFCCLVTRKECSWCLVRRIRKQSLWV